MATQSFKDMYPHCLGCMAIGIERATECVDHIIPHRGNDELFWAEGNWQPSCHWHHNAIKPMLERMWEHKKIRDVDLMLNSAIAIKLTRQRHRPEIGVDGLPIAGT